MSPKLLAPTNAAAHYLTIISLAYVLPDKYSYEVKHFCRGGVG
jgi:hypothetical protein